MDSPGYPSPLVAMVSGKEEVRQELTDLAQATLDDPDTKNTMAEGHAHNMQGRLLLRPTGAAHTLEVLHHSVMGHLRIKKPLAKFRKSYTTPWDQSLAKEVVLNCHGCQVGLD